ncbi:MAG TPA: TetR/AcrR family transcriptional regulator [Vicinamibacterales bacterium]|jgi:AcrR family transcriptional regulator|nr:TetR/AcrR family transcriptional regulator [Vicinamibacterales bacterium]
MPAKPRAVPAPRWQRRPVERPQALLDAALKLVTACGYRRVRLADIAREAGVSKATVYHYFSDKDDLLRATVAQRIAQRQAASEEQLAAARGSAASRLRSYLHDFWQFSRTPHAGVWQRLLVSEIVTEAPTVFREWGRGLVHRWRVVEQLIVEGQESGEFRDDADAAVAARLIIATLAHQALFHVHFGLDRLAPCDPDRIFEGAFDLFLCGLSPRSSRPRSR